MDAFLQAAALVFTPTSLIYMFLGVFFGILCGAMPGLSAVMAVSILLPFTFSLDQMCIRDRKDAVAAENLFSRHLSFCPYEETCRNRPFVWELFHRLHLLFMASARNPVIISLF